MTTGTGTYDGLSVPLYGESEIQQQTAATDILTITGAASQSGDFLVLRNSTGAEMFSISSSGLIVSAVSQTYSGGALVLTGALTAALSSSALNGVIVTVTSTGAVADGSLTCNAFLVNASSKSVLNSIIAYNSGMGTAAEVGTCGAFFSVHGTKAPSAFISVGGSVAGVGAAADNGFFNASMTWTTFPTSAIALAGIKFLAGSKAYYIPAYPDTTFNA